jgi:hypothetical protein
VCRADRTLAIVRNRHCPALHGSHGTPYAQRKSSWGTPNGSPPPRRKCPWGIGGRPTEVLSPPGRDRQESLQDSPSAKESCFRQRPSISISNERKSLSITAFSGIPQTISQMPVRQNRDDPVPSIPGRPPHTRVHRIHWPQSRHR